MSAWPEAHCSVVFDRSRMAPLPRSLPPSNGRLGDATLVRLRVRTNSGVEVPVGRSSGCP
jgi:hypothetical protein